MKKILKFLTFIIVFIGLISSFLIKRCLGINFSASLGLSRNSEKVYLKSQSYTFSFSKAITSKMSFGGNVIYSKNERNYEGIIWQENVRPTLYYGIHNDYFNWFLNYNYGITNFSSGEGLKNWAIGSNFRTHYKKYNLNIFCSLSKMWNEGFKNSIKVKNKSFGINLDKNFERGILQGLGLTLGYRFNRNENLINPATVDMKSYNVRLTYYKRIKMFRFGVTQDWNYNEIHGIYSLGPLGKYKIFYSLILTNGTFNSTLMPNQEFYLKIPSDKTLAGIELYADYTLEVEIGKGVTWDVYYSRDGNQWILAAKGVTLPYEFPSSLSYPYIYIKLVVNTITGAVPKLTDPKFIGYYYQTQKEVKDHNSAWRTNLNLGIKLPYKIYLGGTGGLELYKYKLTGNRKREYISINISKFGNKYFSPNLSYFFSKEYFKSQELNRSARIGISITSIPITSIRLNYGYSESKNWYQGILFSINDNIFLNSIFRILPELSASWINNFNILKNCQTGNSTKSYNTQVNFMARPRENINVEWRNLFAIEKTSDGKTHTSRKHEISITWQISSQLTLTTSQSVDDHNNYYYTYMLYILPTKKLRISSNLSGYKTKHSNTLNFSTNAFWRIGRNLNLVVIYGINKIEKTEWQWSFRLRYVM